MKRNLSTTIALLGAVLGLITPLRVEAQSYTGVGVRIWLDAVSDSSGNSSATISGTFLPGSYGSGAVQKTTSCYSTNTEFYANMGLVNIQPGARYVLTGGTTNASGNLFIVPPAGYDTIIAGYYRNAAPMANGIEFRIIPKTDVPIGAAGYASSLSSTGVNWRLSLGSLRNGRDAGEIRLADLGTGSSWSSLFTPAALSYTSTSPEVYVYEPNNIVRQIIANQVAVDVVTLTSSSYEIRCYSPTQIQSYVPCTFSGQPYVTYRIEAGVPDAAHAGDATAVVLKITKEVRNVQDPFQTTVPIARREAMTLQRVGTYPNYTWVKQDWTLDGQTPLCTTTVQSTGTTNGRVESVSVVGAAGATAVSLTRTYTNFSGIGELVTAESLGSTNPLQTTYTYNTSASTPGQLGFVSRVDLPGGSWVKYTYADPSSPNAPDLGVVSTTTGPYYENATTTLDEVVNGVAAPDPFGYYSRPSGGSVQLNDPVNGLIQLGNATMSYDDTDGGANDSIVAVSAFNNGLYIKSRYYKEDYSIEYNRGMPASVVQPDGAMTSYAYEIGAWDGTVFTASGPGGVASSSRITETSGVCVNNQLSLVVGRSTKRTVIRDIRALPIRRETYVWNGAWQLVHWENLTYNLSGLLTKRVSSEGTTYAATWDGMMKASETDESGVSTTYTYDAAGRVATSTRAAANGLPAFATSYTYDAIGDVTKTVVGADGGEQLVSTRGYDDAGRLISETPAGAGTTTYSYDVANRSKTTTRPDGSTIVESTAVNGRPLAKSGTGAVAEFCTYGTEAGAGSAINEWTRIDYGTASSPRWQRRFTDPLGNEVAISKPGFSGQPQWTKTEVYAYSSPNPSWVGHLIKVVVPGQAATLFQYDSLGGLSRQGLDVCNWNSLSLTTNQRITDTNPTFEQFNGDWWSRVDTVTYRTANSSTPTTVRTLRKRLTGFASNVVEEALDTDVQGNVTDTTKTVDRANATVTTTVSRTGQTWKQVTVAVNGLVVKQTGTDGLTTTTGYDALGRKIRVTDARGNATSFAYFPGSTLVKSTTDATNTVTARFTYDGMGRPTSTTDAGNHTKYTSYTALGKVFRQWGDGSYPVEYGYDAYGAKVTMTTYRGGTGWDQPDWPGTGSNSGSPGTGDTTTWSYDPGSGLLSSKMDASGATVTYTYDVAGRLSTRTWARGVSTTYTYDPATGDQTAISYSDSTPALAYEYNRVGEMTKVTQGTGSGSIVEQFDRCICGKVSVDYLDPTFFGGRTLTYKLNTNADGTKGRTLGYTLQAGTTTEQDISYSYEPATDRFSTVGVSIPGIPSAAHVYRYTYLANTDLIQSMAVDDSPFAVSRTFEPKRDVLTSIAAQWGTATRTRFDYQTNAQGQRTSVKQSGDAFADYGDSTYQQFAYDGRGELTSATGYLGGDVTQTTSPLPGRTFSFDYDPIGNRVQAGRTTGAAAEHYTSNALNQIVTKENNTVQVSGTADPAANVAVAGATSAAARQGAYWSSEVGVNNASAPWHGSLLAYVGKRGAGPNGTDLLRIDARIASIAPALQHFQYDQDGNMTTDGIWTYSWDAENRLISMSATVAAVASGMDNRVLGFRYDYLGRRIQKRIYDGGTNQLLSGRRFVYDGWNMIAEYADTGASGPGAIIRSYAWGLDIARTLTDAGSVGALLSETDYATKKTFYATYDGNGNVASLISATSGAVAAAYEYSPFGELLRSQSIDGTVADQPFRFSTQYYDQETGLYAYIHRFYDPKAGRFLGRDSIEEKGGLHLYAFCLNNPINTWDILGNTPGESVNVTRQSLLGDDDQLRDGVGAMDGGTMSFDSHMSSGSISTGSIVSDSMRQSISSASSDLTFTSGISGGVTGSIDFGGGGTGTSLMGGTALGNTTWAANNSGSLSIGDQSRIILGIANTVSPNALASAIDTGIATTQLTGSVYAGVNATLNPAYGLIANTYQAATGLSLNPDSAGATLTTGERIVSAFSATLDGAALIGTAGLIAEVTAPAMTPENSLLGANIGWKGGEITFTMPDKTTPDFRINPTGDWSSSNPNARLPHFHRRPGIGKHRPWE